VAAVTTALEVVAELEVAVAALPVMTARVGNEMPTAAVAATATMNVEAAAGIMPAASKDAMLKVVLR